MEIKVISEPVKIKVEIEAQPDEIAPLVENLRVLFGYITRHESSFGNIEKILKAIHKEITKT